MNYSFHMNEEKEKILSAALDSFMMYGFYKTSMDMLASGLKISKKTIYKHYPAKDDLVKDTAMLFISQNKNSVEKVISGEGDAVSKMHNLIELISRIVIKVSDKFLIDLQTHKPEIWKLVDKFRGEVMTVNLGRIIKQGQKERLIKDYPAPLIINAFISTVRGITSMEFLQNTGFTPGEAVTVSIELLMNGILTDQGKKLFYQEK